MALQQRRKNLYIIIKKKYFDEIAAGTKKVEYRTISDYWTTRLVGRSYAKVIFINGYKKNAKRIRRIFVDVETVTVQHEHFGPDPVTVYAINFQ